VGSWILSLKGTCWECEILGCDVGEYDDCGLCSDTVTSCTGLLKTFSRNLPLAYHVQDLTASQNTTINTLFRSEQLIDSQKSLAFMEFDGSLLWPEEFSNGFL
jgi:hypothetical protein